MTRTALAVVAAMCATLAPAPTVAREPAAPPQPQLFRAGALAVTVDVSVRAGNAPVVGLTAGDFELLDRGVRQRIAAVSMDAVPIDLTVAVDTSSSQYGAIRDLRESSARLAALLLRPVDQFRLIGFGTHVYEAVAMQRGDRPTAIPVLPYGGATSFYDALLLAMLRPIDPDRRHLIVVFSDGYDTMSVASAGEVARVAERSEGLLHLVRLKQRGTPGFAWPSWVGPRDAETIQRAVEATGGQVHDLASASVPDALERVIADFRSSYLLRYAPDGVAPGGWHDVTVRIPRFPRYTVRARPGYFW